MFKCSHYHDDPKNMPKYKCVKCSREIGLINGDRLCDDHDQKELEAWDKELKATGKSMTPGGHSHGSR